MQTNPSPSSHISDSGVTVPISHHRGEYIVHYRYGQRARSRAFDHLDQAREFGRFLAHRQHWAQVAEELAEDLPAPVRSFRVAPTTSTLMAFDCFLRAMRRNGASQANIGTVVAVLSAAFSHVSAGDLGALSAAWYREQDARSQAQLRTKDARARRRAIVAKFLGWLAHQPLEPQTHSAKPSAPAPKQELLTVAEAEQLLRACPDDDARRYAVLSLFSGLRSGEVAALSREDVTEQRDGLLCRSKGFVQRVPLSANLLAWLQPPTPAQGPVVTTTAARKVRASLTNLKPTAPMSCARSASCAGCRCISVWPTRSASLASRPSDPVTLQRFTPSQGIGTARSQPPPGVGCLAISNPPPWSRTVPSRLHNPP